MSFLPNDYIAPKEKSNWFSIDDGETHNIRIMGQKDRPESFTLGWQGFKDNQPIYRPYNESGYKEVFEYLNADKNDDEKKTSPIHFWMVAIYHEDDKCAMVWNIRQKTIQQNLTLYMLDKEWGDPNNYILKVSRVGKGLSDTVYSVTPKSPNIAPPSDEIIQIMNEAQIDCRAVYTGGQPMGALKDYSTEKVEEDHLEDPNETLQRIASNAMKK